MGNAVTAWVAVIREVEKDGKVVEELDTETGTEVVNVVKTKLRGSDEEVALAGMKEEGDLKAVEDRVRAVDGVAGDFVCRKRRGRT